MKELADYIWDLEKQLFERALRLPLEDLIHDDFVEFGASGIVYGKAELLADGLSSHNSKCSGSDAKIRLLADDLVQVTYISSRDGARALRSSLWKKQNEKWQMIFHQGTLI